MHCWLTSLAIHLQVMHGYAISASGSTAHHPVHIVHSWLVIGRFVLGAINIVGLGRARKSDMEKPLPCFKGHSPRTGVGVVRTPGVDFLLGAVGLSQFVAMPFAPSSYLLRVVRPGAPSSVLSSGGSPPKSVMFFHHAIYEIKYETVGQSSQNNPLTSSFCAVVMVILCGTSRRGTACLLESPGATLKPSELIALLETTGIQKKEAGAGGPKAA